MVVPIELLDGTRGRDFILRGFGGRERFAARLLDGDTSLNVGWTDIVPRTVLRLREVQRLAGGEGSFTRIAGTASDRLEGMILAGQFKSGKVAKLLIMALGGNWRVSVAKKPGMANVFEVAAERMEISMGVT